MAYKILSLDGGGSWALIQARVLQDIYGEIKGHELLKQFDMAIANSGGSLVLACLCNDMSMSEIINVFNIAENRKKVFSNLRFGEKEFLQLLRRIVHIGPKYKTSRKIGGLREVLTHYNPNEIQPPIVDTYLNKIPAIIGKNYNNEDLQIIISGFDYLRQRVSFFRSNAESNTDRFNNGKFFQITLGDAIHASSNAPVNYFDEAASVHINLLTDIAEDKEEKETWFWDGGVAGFNNPVLAGLVEAITNNAGKALDEYKILSIGTGLTRKAIISDYKTSTNTKNKKIYQTNKDKPFVESKVPNGLLHDIQEIAHSILSDPPDSATFIAYSFLDPSLQKAESNLVRINPCLSPVFKNGTYHYPDVYNKTEQERKDFITLMEMDMDAIEDEQVKLIDQMCNKFIVNDSKEDSLLNQLIRGNEGDGNLGYTRYSQAKDRWMQINNDTSQ